MARILVVDDDRAIREFMKFALECDGHTVTAHVDGGDLLRALAGVAEPSIIVTDLMMPGIDGWEVCRRLAAEPEMLSRRRVVVMTALRMAEEEYPAPACAMLYKPFDLDALLRLVARLDADLPAPPVRQCGETPVALAS